MAGEFDWGKVATGGATRPDSFTGMDPRFGSALANMFAAAPANVQSALQVSSGYRSPERQAQLWQDALAKYGSADAARKWVAPPGNSNHNHGVAADLKYLAPIAKDWAHQNAAQFGLSFPLSNEDWHVELAGARDGTAPTAVATAPAAAAQAAPVAAAPAAASPFAAPTTPEAQLAALFMQGAAEQKRRREDEQAAEATRRAALFRTTA